MNNQNNGWAVDVKIFGCELGQVVRDECLSSTRAALRLERWCLNFTIIIPTLAPVRRRPIPELYSFRARRPQATSTAVILPPVLLRATDLIGLVQ